ncbi:hypothetical protein J7E97_11315 [Streptomyces sp. ISL-66]|uniref:hypothetical protein n=1 Tax=Streptomyces sp. ISL-66 TaxID=2819186 RepID=UPI001BE6E049|nr:hypothetical protein [Streptomyces sp. ISL-66]MBT2468450.1 hypothetical protein [Streptomyces sp. ISL-66]
MTRFLGGGALVCAISGIWILLYHAGMDVRRPDVTVPWGAALVLAAGWVWAGSRPVPVPPLRTVDPAPAPPTRLPMRRFRGVLPWLLTLLVVWPALSVVTEVSGRADGDDMRRIAAIQKAGAAVAKGRVVDVQSLVRNGNLWYDGDVTVELPVRTGGASHGTVEVLNAHFGQKQKDLGYSYELGNLDKALAATAPVPVLYAPTAPELGGVIDINGNVGRYAAADSPYAFSSAPGLTQFLLWVPGSLVLLVLLCTIPFLRALRAGRTLRSDARDGAALPAVRAKITSARRDDHTALGRRDGTVAVKSRHRLRFELEDGSELLIGAGTLGNGPKPQQLARLAARLGDRPGWLCGARNWRLIRHLQPVVFVTDEGEALWLTMEREDFERVIAPAGPVELDPERRVALCPTPSAVVAGAHWPWLGGMLLSYALTVLVLIGPMTSAASFWLTMLATTVLLASTVLLFRRRSRLGGRTGRWAVHETRAPEIGPA